jgi:hypothetical protein
MTGTFRHVVDIYPSPSIRQLPGVRGLFQQRVAGDDALLRLAALRFAQAGMPCELYADTPAEVERLLRYVPHHETRPTVHLNRGVNLLDHDSQEAVLAFVTQLDDRVSGLIVHDKPGILEQVPALNDALRIVSDRAHGPHVFLEYAVELDWFADIARRAADIERAGVCVDIGHMGLAEVRQRLGASLPGTAHLSANDPALADHVTQVQQATRAALPAMLSRLNYWPSVIAANHMLATTMLAQPWE